MKTSLMLALILFSINGMAAVDVEVLPKHPVKCSDGKLHSNVNFLTKAELLEVDDRLNLNLNFSFGSCDMVDGNVRRVYVPTKTTVSLRNVGFYWPWDTAVKEENTTYSRDGKTSTVKFSFDKFNIFENKDVRTYSLYLTPKFDNKKYHWSLTFVRDSKGNFSLKLLQK